MIDPHICGDDGPITPEQCAQWLDAKYRRHNELEDRAAALWLRKLSVQLKRLTDACRHEHGRRNGDGGAPECPICHAIDTNDREYEVKRRR